MKRRQQSALMTMDELITTHLPDLVQPVRSKKTLGRWFRRAQIPVFKANPEAPHGGGIRFFSVAAVERLFRSRAVTHRRAAPAAKRKRHGVNGCSTVSGA